MARHPLNLYGVMGMYDMDALVARLRGMGDAAYADFNAGLVPGIEGNALGVRMPALRSLAREIAKDDWRDFLEKSRSHPIYEVRMLHGMVLGVAKCDIQEKIRLTDAFIPYIDNWAVCDGYISSLKLKGGDREPMFDYACACAGSDIEYRNRFGMVTLMRHYGDAEHIGKVLEVYRGFHHDGYYARMGAAWGLATLWLSDRAGCLAILEENLWDEYTHNKAIQKLCESRRVSDEDKALARSLTRTG